MPGMRFASPSSPAAARIVGAMSMLLASSVWMPGSIVPVQRSRIGVRTPIS